ncbi:hypothetical protein C8J56DRAFT_1049083 [Mycena floridula]|nr:hypothetical protein C8J56DRAFT_1049083 [Mycena floridula]
MAKKNNALTEPVVRPNHHPNQVKRGTSTPWRSLIPGKRRSPETIQQEKAEKFKEKATKVAASHSAINRAADIEDAHCHEDAEWEKNADKQPTKFSSTNLNPPRARWRGNCASVNDKEPAADNEEPEQPEDMVMDGDDNGFGEPQDDQSREPGDTVMGGDDNGFGELQDDQSGDDFHPDDEESSEGEYDKDIDESNDEDEMHQESHDLPNYPRLSEIM